MPVMSSSRARCGLCSLPECGRHPPLHGLGSEPGDSAWMSLFLSARFSKDPGVAFWSSPNTFLCVVPASLEFVILQPQPHACQDEELVPLIVTMVLLYIFFRALGRKVLRSQPERLRHGKAAT